MDVSTKKNIVILIPCLYGGGAERVAVTLANKLKDKYNITIINLEEGMSYNLEEKIERILISNLDGRSDKIKKLLFFPYQVLKIYNVLKKKNKPLVISFMERTSFILWLLNYKNSIYSFRNYESDQIYREHEKNTIIKFIRNFAYDLFLRNCYKKTKLITIISKLAAYDLTQRFGVPEGKIKVIYNFYPIEEIRNLSKEPVEDIFEKNPYLMNVGRLEKQKGQWHLLRTFKKLKEQFPGLKLLILGEGKLKDYLVNLSKDLGFKTYVWDKDKLSENFDVYFLGFQKNPFKYVSRAKLFVFPSLWEGFPNALVEAMACGVPVISSDCRSGPREILAPNTDFRKQTGEPEFAEYGILMPVLEKNFLSAKEPLTKTEKIWFKLIKKLLEDRELREKYAKISIKRAMDFHMDKIVKEWEKILEAALSKNHEVM